MRRAANRLLGRDDRDELTAEDYASMLSSDYAATVVVKMREQGLKFKDLAKRMGISPVALSRRLRSENMTMKTMAEFALALGYEVDTPEMFSLDEEETAVPKTSAMVVSEQLQMVADELSTRVTETVMLVANAFAAIEGAVVQAAGVEESLLLDGVHESTTTDSSVSSELSAANLATVYRFEPTASERGKEDKSRRSNVHRGYSQDSLKNVILFPVDNANDHGAREEVAQ